MCSFSPPCLHKHYDRFPIADIQYNYLVRSLIAIYTINYYQTYSCVILYEEVSQKPHLLYLEELLVYSLRVRVYRPF